MDRDRVFRWSGIGDHAALAELMFDAVRSGPSPYSEKQRAAWVPAPRSGPEWEARLAGQDVIVAEAGGRMLGFMSLAAGGYVDFAYIRAEARGGGLFGQLLGRIEDKARGRGGAVLWVHASLAAEPAFARHGFSVRKREQVSIGGEMLDRCEMEKRLA